MIMIMVCIEFTLFGNSTDMYAKDNSDTYYQPQIITLQKSEIPNEQSVIISEYKVPEIETKFKTYMDYRTITNEESLQWELQQQAYTNEFGLRKIGESYCVAVGTYYADKCGKLLIVTLDNGKKVEVIVSDIKDNIHTDENNMYTPMANGNGNLLEFIVDTKKLPAKVKKLGDVSPLGIEGTIKNIEEVSDDNK